MRAGSTVNTMKKNRKLIFSIFVDFNKAGGDLQEYEPRHRLNVNNTLISYLHDQYAKKCGADYKLVGYGKMFNELRDYLKKKKIYEGEYQSIQHFKFYLLEKFAKEYDEIVYFDSDVVPITSENIFKEFDFSKGVLMHGFHDDTPTNSINLSLEGQLSYTPMPRSVSVKYALMRVLCENKKVKPVIDRVLNTGIMGFTSQYIQDLNYIKSLPKTAKEINKARTKKSTFFQKEIQEMFNMNNESIVTYLISASSIPFQSMDPDWHWVWNHRNSDEEICTHAKIVHIINKRFEKFFGIERVS